MSTPTPQQPAIRDNHDLHMRLLADVAQDLSGEVSFPTSLDLAIRMRGSLNRPDISVEELTRVVAMEPVIASRLMRLAHGDSTSAADHADHAHHAVHTPVAELRAAIETLGLEQARSAALGVAMDQMMKAKDMAPFNRYANLNWEHSVRAAVLSRALARHAGHIDPDSALLAGLVHDIGVYYLFYRASKYNEYREDHDALIELVLGWHESIGENVLEALGYPADIVEASHEHDVPRVLDRAPRNLNEVVYIANILAGNNWEWLPNSTTPQQMADIERTRQRYAFLLPQVEGEIRAMHAALSDQRA
jgi:HD-like signal output (HDOD) protein